MQKAKASQFTTAIAVYKPTEPDQISLEEGDFVEILNKSDDQEWWYGQKVRGKKTGWFPSTYVKPIGGKVGGAVAGFLGALSERQQKDASRQSAPQKAANKLNGSSFLTAENQEFRSKLEMVLQKNPETKRPAPPSYHAAKDDSSEERPKVLKALNKNKHLVVAIAAYLATSPNQLNLSIGDVIDVGQETASGWSNGCLLNCIPRRHGWFPSSYVKTLGTEYGLTELKNTFEREHRSDKAYDPELDYQDRGNLSDQSFESDDSDYESGTQQSSSGAHEAFLGPQTWTPKMPIAIMSVESIDAVQLYAQNRSFPMYLNLTMATEWQHAPAIMTTKSTPMKPASSFYSTTSIYSAEWVVNFRLNIFSTSESLIIQCCGEPDQNESLNCLAEARMPVFDLIKQSRHLKKFTKGLPLRILNQEALVPPDPNIKPCFLVKFDIIDLKV